MLKLYILITLLACLSFFIQAQEPEEISTTVQQLVPSLQAKSVAIKISLGTRLGFGSGAIISQDGLILTCAHVTEIAETLTVITSDGQEYPAVKLGMNSANDYSLIKIDVPQKLPYFELGSSENLKLLQWVIALGHPGGPYPDYAPAVAIGRVRAMHKQLPIELGAKFYDDTIQTDVPIFSGNSGGPLADLEGKLVGINGAIMMFSDFSFTVPIDEIKPDLNTMKAGKNIAGRTPKNFLETIRIMLKWQEDIPPQDMQRMFDHTPLGRMMKSVGGFEDVPAIVPPLGAKFTKNKGMLQITQIDNNSIAALADLQVGDQIISIAGRKITSGVEAMKIFAEADIGQEIPVSLMRNYAVKNILVIMDRRAYSRSQWLKEQFFDVGLKISPSVVKIFSSQELRGYGVVIDAEKNLILTAMHVLTNDAMIIEVPQHKASYPASIIAKNGLHNLALLQIIPNKPLKTIDFGNISNLKIGSWVISGGHDQGVFHVGMVSMLDRRIPSHRRIPTLGIFGLLGTHNKGPVRAYDNIIQHDSDIEENQLGMPLVDSQGKLVGLNVGSFYRGTTFAIPISIIQEVLPNMKNGINTIASADYRPYEPEIDPLSKAVEYFLNPTEEKKQDFLEDMFQKEPEPKKRGFLGVQLQEHENGAEIIGVLPGYAAEKAGFKTGDIITQINQTTIRTPEQAVEVLKELEPGTEISVQILRRQNRKYQTIEFRVVLDERPYQD